jgi:hypothetical protein
MIVPNLVLHVIPEQAGQMAACVISLTLLDPLPVLVVVGGFTLIFSAVMILRGTSTRIGHCGRGTAALR